MSVISTTDMVSRVETGIPTPRPTSQFTMLSEKFSAAKALPRKPDRVIATCIVARKRAGWLVRPARRFAFLLPLWAITESFASFTERTAISAQANTALSKIRASWSKSIRPMESFNVNTSFSKS